MAKNTKEKKYVMLAAALCAASIIAMIIALCAPRSAVVGEFIPPEFDASALVGEPSVPSELGYMEPYKEGMSFRAAVCGNLVVNGGEADVYFTNKSESDVWLLLRVTDENGEVLAETGLVRAGEYVKTIRFEKVPTEGQKVLYKVMAYEPETYLSMGYFTVRTEAHIGK